MAKITTCLSDRAVAMPCRILLTAGLVSLLLCGCTVSSEKIQSAEAIRNMELPEGKIDKSTTGSLNLDAQQKRSDSRQVSIGSDSRFDSKCLATIAEADADASVLAAPSLAASIDHEGDSQISMSYDLVNLRSMRLQNELALAECELDAVLKAARVLERLTARSLTVEGLISRVRYIDQHKARFRQMRHILEEKIASGEEKPKSVERVYKSISKLLERANSLRAKADVQDRTRLEALPIFLSVEQRLYDATLHLQSLEKESDTIRNLRFTLSGGYSFENADETTEEDEETEFFGRAALSVRLGVFSPAYQSSLQAKLQADLDQYYEPKTGTIWRIQETHRKNRISMKAMRVRRQELLKKIAANKHAISSQESPALSAKFSSEVERIGLKSELKEIEKNLQVLHQAQRILSP